MERREREQLQQERGRVRGRKKAYSVAHSNLDRERERESEKGTKLSDFRNSSSSQPFAKRETLKDFFLNLEAKILLTRTIMVLGFITFGLKSNRTSRSSR